MNGRLVSFSPEGSLPAFRHPPVLKEWTISPRTGSTESLLLCAANQKRYFPYCLDFKQPPEARFLKG
jgi:hypothetical protein